MGDLGPVGLEMPIGAVVVEMRLSTGEARFGRHMIEIVQLDLRSSLAAEGPI